MLKKRFRWVWEISADTADETKLTLVAAFCCWGGGWRGRLTEASEETSDELAKASSLCSWDSKKAADESALSPFLAPSSSSPTLGVLWAASMKT